MKTEKISTIKIELEGKEVDDFKSAIAKINEENHSAGFKKFGMTADEVQLIKGISEKVKDL